jgi:hypothetical protein
MKNELKVTFRNATINDDLFGEESNQEDISVIISSRYQTDDEATDEAIMFAKAALGLEITSYDYADIEPI